MIRRSKGQITIWIIIAALIVVGIVILFLFAGGPKVIVNKEFNVESYIDKCTRDAVNEASEKMMLQGGFIEPRAYKLYEGNKVAYLCENIGYFDTCINQHPMLLNEMKSEIVNYTFPIIDSCFNELKTYYEQKGGSLDFTQMYLTVEYGPKRIYMKIERKVSLKDGANERAYDGFDVEVISPLYDLSNVAIEIASQEAKYCYFEYVGYMILYRQFDIKKFVYSDATKIYTVQDLETGKKMNIATRSCAYPPGI